MPLQPGDKLGPYEILAPIGAGGMGEVYRARDPRLNRDVAIKVSAAQFSERFEREAKAIAALNHPNICQIYDVGPNYLVMEYVEGAPLKGPLPLDQTLKYAVQICDALDAAHKKNITHRDLKPANILVTRTGVKLLDFGLAKMGPAVKADEATMTMALTGKGEILGTLLYMSPEQVNGEEAGPRSDIFSFGLVLYEVVTGKKAFEGKSHASLIAAILEREPPPMSSLQPMTPPALDRVVKKCLAKEPEKRWQAASDISDALKWIAEDSASHGGPSAGPVATARVGSRWLLVSAVACVLAAAVAALTVWLLKPAAPKPVTRFAMSLPPGQRLALGRPELAISPDGTRLVYSAGQGTIAVQLYLRAMDGLEARAIPGTEGAVNPFFSPDGQWIGFLAGGKLKKVSLNGGPPVSLVEGIAGNAVGASWGSQGVIAFASVGPIKQVSDAGGNVQPLVRLDKGEITHAFPEFLPNGTGLLFAASSGAPGAVRVAVQSLKTGERRELVQAGNLPRYAPSGHIIYSQGANLLAAPFDLRRLSVTGGAVPVIEGVMPLQYSFSSTGSLVYVPGSVQGPQLKLVWVDGKGVEQPVLAPAHNYVMPRLSPDGQRVAAAIEEADSQIWLYDLARETLTRLTFDGTNNVDPVWTPDGKRIAFKGAANRLFWQPADGSGAAEALTNDPLGPNNIPGSWSPDGQTLLFYEQAVSRSLWILSLKDRKPQPFGRGPSFSERAPRFSPDGLWVAYASDESGQYQIYVRPYPGPGRKWQISTEGGTEPVWNPKGRELFYRNRDKMMVVEVTTQPAFSPGKPRLLFEGAYVLSPRSLPNYDVSPDGQRFLMLKAAEQAQALMQINVVLNWFEELKRRVPSGAK